MSEYWLPPHLHERGAQLAATIESRLGEEVIGAIDYWLELPERAVNEPTRPSTPRPWGEGYICVDIGPDDQTTWRTFAAIAQSDLDPESVARRAQVWRLPVTPYRSKSIAQQPNNIGDCTRHVDLRTVRVVDLTSMWAGPFCTELLARAGARVVKIEPSSRPDGLRYGDGDDGSGNAPMFVELNKSKEIADIDLRYCSEGGEFHQLLRSADIVITSLSPRANANLGITTERLHAVNPDLALLSITAFAPEVNESDWVAYGTGVHAASGMGWLNGCPLTPAFSYPDPLAGLEACATAIAQLAGNAPKYRRVSLDRSVAGLKRSP
ncbi:MAG TPA: hypothetical protein EYG17_01100 [Acidimicrobiia bacterium]|jgi:hypothetical protein|nr:hypothetical protein [Acidimicrobiia bacterium]HIL04630.1 hypothetical protein [Acidimicrobiia bacterium]